MEEDFGDSFLGRTRTTLWDFLEKPWTSTAAQGYAIFALIVILISTVTFVASTFEELQLDENGRQNYPNIIYAIEILGSVCSQYYASVPLLICTGFLKYPFGHLFQTEIKIDFKTN